MRNGRARAYIRGGAEKIWTDLTGSPQANNRGELVIAQALPSLVEGTRLNNGFICTYSEYTPSVSGAPNTSNSFKSFLYNGENWNGKSYVIIELGAYHTFSSGLGSSMALAGHLFVTNPFPLSVFLVPSNTSIIPRVGNSKYNGFGICHSGLADSLAPNEGNAHNISSSINDNTNNVTHSISKDIYGRYVIPPLGCFGFILLTIGATSPNEKVVPYIIWQEIQMSQG